MFLFTRVQGNDREWDSKSQQKMNQSVCAISDPACLSIFPQGWSHLPTPWVTLNQFWWTIHHLAVAAWSMRVTSELLPVNTANGGPYLHKPEYSGLKLDSRQARRSLSHCTNETIHHSFVCLYAPSHEQLMRCRHFSAFLFYLYLTFPCCVWLSET